MEEEKYYTDIDELITDVTEKTWANEPVTKEALHEAIDFVAKNGWDWGYTEGAHDAKVDVGEMFSGFLGPEFARTGDEEEIELEDEETEDEEEFFCDQCGGKLNREYMDHDTDDDLGEGEPIPEINTTFDTIMDIIQNNPEELDKVKDALADLFGCGYQRGWNTGWDYGFTAGNERGRNDFYKEGYDDGWTRGRELSNNIMYDE